MRLLQLVLAEADPGGCGVPTTGACL